MANKKAKRFKFKGSTLPEIPADDPFYKGGSFVIFTNRPGSASKPSFKDKASRKKTTRRKA